jgi:hypothetical protein
MTVRACLETRVGFRFYSKKRLKGRFPVRFSYENRGKPSLNRVAKRALSGLLRVQVCYSWRPNGGVAGGNSTRREFCEGR